MANVQLGNDLLITLLVLVLKIVEKTSAITNHLDQAVPGTMVLRVPFQVIGKLLNPFGKNSYLHIGRTSVTIMTLKLFLDGFLVYLAHFTALYPVFLVFSLYVSRHYICLKIVCKAILESFSCTDSQGPAPHETAPFGADNTVFSD